MLSCTTVGCRTLTLFLLRRDERHSCVYQTRERIGPFAHCGGKGGKHKLHILVMVLGLSGAKIHRTGRGASLQTRPGSMLACRQARFDNWAAHNVKSVLVRAPMISSSNVGTFLLLIRYSCADLLCGGQSNRREREGGLAGVQYCHPSKRNAHRHAEWLRWRGCKFSPNRSNPNTEKLMMHLLLTERSFCSNSIS